LEIEFRYRIVVAVAGEGSTMPRHGLSPDLVTVGSPTGSLEKKHRGKHGQMHYFPLPRSWCKQYYSSSSSGSSSISGGSTVVIVVEVVAEV
jgi:hypothetical protein